LLFAAFISALIATPAAAQENTDEILDRHVYQLHSSKSTGVAPVSGRAYNYIVRSDCRLSEQQAMAFSTALADSIATAESSLGKVIVWLYLEGMDPKSGAYSRSEVVDGNIVTEKAQPSLLLYTDAWDYDSPACQW